MLVTMCAKLLGERTAMGLSILLFSSSLQVASAAKTGGIPAKGFVRGAGRYKQSQLQQQ